MREAEQHGRRVLAPTPVAVLDGFSLILRSDFARTNPFRAFARELGVVHHAYDVGVGCQARRLGHETWMLPVACHHYGGQTAVANTVYHQWADQTTGVVGEGDLTFWHAAHKAIYDEYRDVLPFRV
jgi:hypothetical protein